MIEQKRGHHHKQTNSQPMRGEEVAVNNRGGGGVRQTAFTEETDAYSSSRSAQLDAKHGRASKAAA